MCHFLSCDPCYAAFPTSRDASPFISLILSRTHCSSSVSFPLTSAIPRCPRPTAICDVLCKRLGNPGFALSLYCVAVDNARGRKRKLVPNSKRILCVKVGNVPTSASLLLFVSGWLCFYLLLKDKCDGVRTPCSCDQLILLQQSAAGAQTCNIVFYDLIFLL